MQAIDQYDPIERHVGNGLLDEYSFEFLITEAAQLIGIVLDDSGEEILRFRGNESISFFTSLEFDATNGGGTINLLANLDTNYTLILLLAADEPVQTSNFTAVGVFALDYLQAALNKLGAFIQRASWLAQRGLRLNDAYNDVFDPQLPLVLEADRTLCISPTGIALALGPTIDELLGASADVADAITARIAAEAAQLAAENAAIAAGISETNASVSASNAAGSAVAAAASALAASGSATAANASAIAAAASAAAALTSENNAETAETNAETAETNAETAQAAAEVAQAAAEAAAASIGGGGMTGPFAVLENNNSNLLGEVTASGTYTAAEYVATIKRGTTVFAIQEFTIVFRNGAWELFLGSGWRHIDSADHGVTFTAHAVTAQINAAVDNSGAGNATIRLRKINWAA